MKHMTVSVIICTKNRIQDFKNTVISLTHQNRMPDELIVVDSSDDTAIQEYMALENFPFERHYFHAGPGLTYARNIGIQKSSGDILFFFDDDVKLEPNYISYVEHDHYCHI